MAIIHFLNVNNGDCSVIEHKSGHVTVIDVCNAKAFDPSDESFSAHELVEQSIRGNFRQKEHPVNPIAYMHDQAIDSIFRYIQTHPDMDHMDGIKALFKSFSPINFWDTDNIKNISNSSWAGSPYSQEDWEFYKYLRDTHLQHDPRRLALLSGARGPYYNTGTNSLDRDGDGLYILAPTQELVETANEADNEYNDCSYVLLYVVGKNRIVFAGDSHDNTWEYILAECREDITNIDLLIAPHHGRDSKRSYEFLDTLKPTLTFFGNARSEHLAYGAWNRRYLSKITNNQAGCMVVDAQKSPMHLWVTNKSFAERINRATCYNKEVKAWYVGPITEELIP